MRLFFLICRHFRVVARAYRHMPTNGFAFSRTCGRLAASRPSPPFGKTLSALSTGFQAATPDSQGESTGNLGNLALIHGSTTARESGRRSSCSLQPNNPASKTRRHTEGEGLSGSRGAIPRELPPAATGRDPPWMDRRGFVVPHDPAPAMDGTTGVRSPSAPPPVPPLSPPLRIRLPRAR